jgi:hypothetical protein
MVDGRWEGNGKRSEGVKETAPGGEQEQMMNGRVSGWRQLWRAEWRLKKKKALGHCYQLQLTTFFLSQAKLLPFSGPRSHCQPSATRNLGY